MKVRHCLPPLVLVAALAIVQFYNGNNRRPQVSDSAVRQLASMFLLPSSLPELTELERKRAKLGRNIFFDQRFSRSKTVACSTCHQPNLSFTDGRANAVGESETNRNAPTLINSHAMEWFFWDGRADSLAAQALGPFEAPAEHGLSRVEVVRLLKEHYKSEYIEAFGRFPDALVKHPLPESGKARPEELHIDQTMAAYLLASIPSLTLQTRIMNASRREGISPNAYLQQLFALPAFTEQEEADHQLFEAMPTQQRDAVNQVFAHIGVALAEFQRTIVTKESAFDRFATNWLKSDDESPYPHFDSAFGENEYEGLQLFVGKAQCANCHFGPLFSDQQFHNIGLPSRSNEIMDLPLGRAAGVLRALADEFNCQGKFMAASHQESCREMAFLKEDALELLGAFKTPTLRNVSTTSPYMHDGRFETLAEVIDHYNSPNIKPALGHRTETIGNPRLSRSEMRNLEAFLRSLTSEVQFLGSAQFSASDAQ